MKPDSHKPGPNHGVPSGALKRELVAHGGYVMGTTTPRAFLASYLDYTLAGGIAEQITCPTLTSIFRRALVDHGPAVLAPSRADYGIGV